MSIKIGAASKDENNKYIGGLVGDQTGKELKIGHWYDAQWDVYLECIDQNIADKAATYMEQICKDDNYGYDQGERFSGYDNIVKNKGIVKGAKGEFDCSALVTSCYKLAGLNITKNVSSKTLKDVYAKTGMFKIYTEKKYVTEDSYAVRGGIYLKEGRHVMMALEKGSKNKSIESTKPEPIKSNVDKTVIKPISSTLRIGSIGKEVETLQKNLNKLLGLNLIVDGIFGKGTTNAVKLFQKNYGLIADGIYGKNSDKKMCYLLS